VETELKRPIAEVFGEFSDAPIASGSIGQVYYALLRDGRPVVVKVKRPDIEKTILADLDLLEFGAPLADRLEELKPLRLPVIVEEFRRSIIREMNFVTEASYTTKIGEDLAGNHRVHIPAVHWDLTTSSVLVLERIAGVSLNRKEELAALKVDRKQLARDLTEVFLHQFFKTGLFHADPHPGNILITPEGKIGLVDFGMTGRLSPDLRGYLATSLIAIARRDLGVITDVYMEIGALSPDTDVEQLKADLQESLDQYYGIPIGALDIGRCFSDAMRIARVHRVLLPRDFVLLGKSFVTMAMMARELDPEFDISAVAKPYAVSLFADKFSPANIGQSLMHELWYVGQSLSRLPREMRTLMRKLINGSLTFTLHLQQFENFVRELDRATNRLAFSIIVAAIVIGSSVLLHAHVPPLMERLPGRIGAFFANYMPHTSLLGLTGFLIAGVFGLLLVAAIWRSGKM
jgi:ubiquinone biosynthesis protein